MPVAVGRYSRTVAFDRVKNFFNVEIKDGVRGAGVVKSASQPHWNKHRYNVSMSLEVSVEGWEPYTVSHNCMVDAGKHPDIGVSLPLTIDRDNPERMRVEWDEYLPPHEQLEADLSRELGEEVNVLRLSDAEPDEKMLEMSAEAEERAREVAARMLPPTMHKAPDDLDRLKKLGELRDQGLLTDEEFAAKKAEILGEI
jgi:hypothetical protein